MKAVGLLIFATIGIAMFVSGEINQSQAQEQVEVGKVNWMRDFEQAKSKSAKSGKPMFVQFQEVPG